MASPFALSLAAALPKTLSRAAPAATRQSCSARAFSSLRTPLLAPSRRLPAATTSSVLQARHLSLGWPFKKTEPDLIVPRAPADIEPSPLASPSSSLPVNPNPLPSTPVSSAGTPTAPEPILASTPSPNLPQPPKASTVPIETTVQDATPAEVDMGSIVDPATGILENGVDLRYLPEHFGDLKAQGLCSWWPSGLVQSAMEAIHVGTGIPWWGTIIVFTLLARATMFPLIVGGMRSAARFTKIQPQMKQYQDAMASHTDPGTKALLMKEMQALMKRENISLLAPLKAPLISMPVFLGTFWGLEAMCNLPVWQLKVQGVAWFHDLTASDPTYILPITSAVATWCIIHFGAAGTPPSATAQANGELMNALRGFMKKAVICGIPIFGGFTIPASVPLIGGLGPAGFPAAVLLYWSFSNGFTALQSFALSRPAVRAYLDLPVIPPVDPTAPKIKQRGLLTIMQEKFAKMSEEAKQKAAAEAASSRALLQNKQQQAVASRPSANRRQDLWSDLEDESKPLERVAANFKKETARRAPAPSGGLTREQELLKAARAQTDERQRLESLLLKQNAQRLKELKPK